VKNKKKFKTMAGMHNFYSTGQGKKRSQQEYSDEEDLSYGSRGNKSKKYSALDDSGDDVLQILEPASDVAAFLTNIQNQNAANSGEASIQAMSKVLEKGARYNILNIREIETKYGRNQAWKLQKSGEVAVVEVWCPYSAAKHISDTDGTVSEHKKALMLQLIMHYRGFTGSKERPSRYNIDFLAC
jgi:hypothetical protein